jgi:hypothetical protein
MDTDTARAVVKGDLSDHNCSNGNDANGVIALISGPILVMLASSV